MEEINGGLAVVAVIKCCNKLCETRQPASIEVGRSVVRACLARAVGDRAVSPKWRGRLTVELRLGECAPTGALPPVPRSRSASEASRDADITEIYHRVREVRAVADDSVSDAAEITERVLALERQPVSSAQDAELGAGVSALEDRAAPSGALTADALSTAVALRFGEIAGDRDALDAAMHVQFEAQTTANAQLRLEIIDLRKTLAAVQTTLVRLELGGRSQPRAEPAARSVTHPPPACGHAPAPRRTTSRQSAPADYKAS
ncbi:hypothetical protein B0H11DRAFT_2347614 [Mycena galericulata]|nr:hypothetical protein B0H11DRAFT_2347614 [Mycena galericulata]